MSFVTYKEFAVLCGVSRSTVKGWVASGKLARYGDRATGEGLKREGLITTEECDRFMRERGMTPPSRPA